MFARRRSTLLRAPLVIAIVALVGVSACGGGAPSAAPTVLPTVVITAAPTPTPTPTPAPTPTPTRTRKPTPAPTDSVVDLQTGRVVLEDLGIAITLADGWTSIPVRADDIVAALGTLDPNDPMVELLQSQLGQVVADGLKLWAFDVRPESLGAGFAPNVNLIAAPPSTMSLETLASFSSSQIAPYLQDGEELDIRSTTIPAGSAVTVSYKVFFPAADGSKINAQGRQLYIKTPTNTLVFTFTCSGKKPAACPADTEAMIKSLDVL